MFRRLEPYWNYLTMRGLYDGDHEKVDEKLFELVYGRSLHDDDGSDFYCGQPIPGMYEDPFANDDDGSSSQSQ